MYDKKGFTVTVRELDITENGNYRPQLRRVKHSEDTNVIISCSIESLDEIMKQAQQVGLFTENHQFIITSLDLHTIDLEPYQHSGANITGFRLIRPDDSLVQIVTNFFAERFKEEGFGEDDNDDDDDEENDEEDDDEENDNENSNDDNKDDNEDNDEEGNDEKNDNDDVPEGLTAEKLRVDTALTYDAVLLFSEVVKKNGGFRRLMKHIKCEDDLEQRPHGISDSLSMNTIPAIRGLSGNIHFDQKGRRSDFHLEIIELTYDGVHIIGTWNTTDRLYLARSHPPIDENSLSLRNKTFIVLTALVSFF
jgi:glutamate receptor, ionotropic, invertebrate